VFAGEFALVADWLSRPFFAGFLAVSGVLPLPSLGLPRFLVGLSEMVGLPPMESQYSWKMLWALLRRRVRDMSRAVL